MIKVMTFKLVNDYSLRCASYKQAVSPDIHVADSVKMENRRRITFPEKIDLRVFVLEGKVKAVRMLIFVGQSRNFGRHKICILTATFLKKVSNVAGVASPRKSLLIIVSPLGDRMKN